MEVETLEKFVCELIRSHLLINDAIKTNTALSWMTSILHEDIKIIQDIIQAFNITRSVQTNNLSCHKWLEELDAIIQFN